MISYKPLVVWIESRERLDAWTRKRLQVEFEGSPGDLLMLLYHCLEWTKLYTDVQHTNSSLVRTCLPRVLSLSHMQFPPSIDIIPVSFPLLLSHSWTSCKHNFPLDSPSNLSRIGLYIRSFLCPITRIIIRENERRKLERMKRKKRRRDRWWDRKDTHAHLLSVCVSDPFFVQEDFISIALLL